MWAQRDFKRFVVQFLRFVIIFISFSDRFWKNYGFSDEKYEQLIRTTSFLMNIRTFSCFRLRTDRTRTDLPIYGLSVLYTDFPYYIRIVRTLYGLSVPYTVGCPIKNIKFYFHGGSIRLGNFKLLLNCTKKNQPDWIRFQTTKESSKISPSFSIFIEIFLKERKWRWNLCGLVGGLKSYPIGLILFSTV
jgi:hypothetical protein